VTEPHRELAAEVIRLLVARGETLAVAESLTGGLLAGALTAIPGASAVFRGAVVAYATDLKSSLLGVPAQLLDRYGAVHPEVAAAMAEGVCCRLAAAAGAATTGVAGPDPADGQPVGTVHIAVSVAGATTTRALALSGDRRQIRSATVEQSLQLLVGKLREESIRLHRYVREHAAMPSPARSVPAGTLEASAERPRKGGDDGPASSLAR
jgi:nicotinamide-nucleotide amidase